jgi:hypothetical protein
VAVSFKLLIEDDWHDVNDVLQNIGNYVRYVLSMAHVSCCSLQAGFFIEIGGALWNGPDYVDEFNNAGSWINALEELILLGKLEASVWAWEESSCKLQRNGDILVLEDIWQDKLICCPRKEVNLGTFARAVIGESWKWERISRAVQAELDTMNLDDNQVDKAITLLENITVDGFRQRLLRLERRLNSQASPDHIGDNA